MRSLQMQRLQHDNVNPLVHAIIEPARICLVSEFQARKSLLVMSIYTKILRKLLTHNTL